MRILLVSNNCAWSSWSEKIKEAREWFDAGKNTKGFKFDLKHTNFTNIPFSPYNNGEGTPSTFGVDPKWYDQNISPLGFGYDIILLVLPRSQWQEPNRARGWRADSDQGPVELQIACDEDETSRAGAWYQFSKRKSAFFLLAEHEILHALYRISGQKDNTHYWWDLGKIEKARDEIIVPGNTLLLSLQRSVAYLTTLLKTVQSMKTLSQKLADLAKSKLGTDFTNDQVVSDDVSCAFAVTTILRELDPTTPIEYGTGRLLDYFKTSGKFERVFEPSAGVLVISATGTNSRPDVMPHGHVGIYLDNDKIMSNSSEDGLWKQNFTRESWRTRFYYKGGFPVFLFKCLN